MLIDSSRKRYLLLDIVPAPERIAESDCAAPPDPARMSTSSLATRERGGERLLYAVNHGDPRSVEMLRIERAETRRPCLLWIGCALLPPHVMPNAVVSLPDGKLVVSSFYDPDDPTPGPAWSAAKMSGVSSNGTRQRLSRARRPFLSGPNGLELNADGGTLFISAWASRKFIMLDLKTGTRQEIPLDFMPDNLRNLPDGRLLVAGQRTTPASISACHSAQCPQPLVIAIVHAQALLTQPGTASINYACTALLKDVVLFVMVRGADRILYRRWRFTP